MRSCSFRPAGADAQAGRDRTQRAHRRRRRQGVPARMQAWLRGHRVEAAERALPIGAIAGLAQGEEPGQPGDGAGACGAEVMAASSGPTIRPGTRYTLRVPIALL